MGVFARRPAPVQASYMAYPATTGARAIDWLITDAYLDPPDAQVPGTQVRVAVLPACATLASNEH